MRGLRVALPDGRVLIDGADLEVADGEVVALLGGSGAGKSTLARVLFERDELAAAGFDVVTASLALDRDQLGLVPQRGALFDHLSVRGNIELALRHGGGDARDAADWLERVGLDPALGDAPVAQLSGGQAQRVAVARVLASRRRLLFLDEPSVGLDPHRVRELARLVRAQVKALGISAIVVTHDVALAAGVADRLLLLSLSDRKLVPLFADRWPGALEDPGHPADARGRWLVELEAVLVEHLEHADRSRAIELRTIQSRTTKSHTTESRTIESHAIKSSTAKSRADESTATESRVTGSPAAESHATESHAGESHAGESHAGESHATESHAGESHATESHATESRATESRATESHAIDVRASESRTTESRAPESRATEARATELPAIESRAADSLADDSPATESRATESHAAGSPATALPVGESPTIESRATESRPTGSLATRSPAAELHTTESRTSKSRTIESRTTESRTAAPHAAESHAAESLAAESHAAESLAAESHAAESLAAESLAAESLAAESRVTGSRTTTARTTEARAAEAHAAEAHAAEAHAAESHATESRATEAHAAESRATESRAARNTLARRLRRRGAPLVAPFAVAVSAAVRVPRQLVRYPGDFAAIAGRVVAQTLIRPLAFYAIVSTLIGYTVLFVISKVGGAGVRPDALIRQIGGSHVVALAPALSALLFVAASGSATNAWLGSMGLTKQTLALDALGVDRRAYLWAPAWLAVALAYLAVAALFALGMIAGGVLVCRAYGVPHAWDLLTGDLLDPRPERLRYTVRAAFLAWIYAWGIASDVVAKGGAAKPDADAVTRGMTASVVACTLWLVAWELVTVVIVFRL